MKTIGFVDHYISEWHAENYPAWIENSNKVLGTDYKLKYVWAEEKISPRNGESTEGWCARFGAEQCASIDELCEKADVIFVLAPSSPEKHLSYAKQVLPYGKITYIDKTFAPDYTTAKEIFDLAKKYGTKFFSTSALRYAAELKTLGAPQKLITTGGGRSFEEYCIHQIEMIVAVMGTEAQSVLVSKEGENGLHCEIGFPEGKSAEIFYAPDKGFTLSADGKTCKVTSDYFGALLTDILRFFEEGTVSFDTKQTLAVMKLRDALLKGMEQEGGRIAL